MRTTLSRIANTELEARAANTVLAVILVGVGSISLLSAYEKPLWFDEILTVIMCRLPSVSKLWQALGNAADTNPPLFYLVAGSAHRLVPDDHLGYRLPSIVGLLVTIICTYLFLSRRTDRWSALVGATFPLCTQLAYYAVEARPYALMTALVSVAILAWQRSDDSRLYSLIMGVALAIALSLHYYAILVWPAFVLAEATVWLHGRRFRIATWMALILSTAPLFVFARLLLHLRQYYGRNFWSRAGFGQIFSAPTDLYNFLDYWVWCLTIGAIVVLVLWSIGNPVRPYFSKPREAAERALPVEESALMAVLLLLPVFAVLAARVTGAGMTFRYMLPTVLGASLAVGFMSSRASREVRAVLLVLVLGNFGLSSLTVMKKTLTGSLLVRRSLAAREGNAILAAYQRFGLPIVIAPSIKYLPMVYYMPVGQSTGLYALADPHAAAAYFNSDSVDLALLALRQYFPIQVEDYRTFASTNREFLLVSLHAARADWWPLRLSHDGDNLTLVSANEGMQVYKVTLISQQVPENEEPGSTEGADTSSGRLAGEMEH
jgi:Dolichyl-phosphate-mannose-protein mannosyltransferase